MSLSIVYSLLTAEDIWFKCELSLQFIPPINLWKICIDLRPFSKCFRVLFLRSKVAEVKQLESRGIAYFSQLDALILKM